MRGLNHTGNRIQGSRLKNSLLEDKFCSASVYANPLPMPLPRHLAGFFQPFVCKFALLQFTQTRFLGHFHGIALTSSAVLSARSLCCSSRKSASFAISAASRRLPQLCALQGRSASVYTNPLPRPLPRHCADFLSCALCKVALLHFAQTRFPCLFRGISLTFSSRLSASLFSCILRKSASFATSAALRRLPQPCSLQICSAAVRTNQLPMPLPRHFADFLSCALCKFVQLHFAQTRFPCHFRGIASTSSAMLFANLFSCSLHKLAFHATFTASR
jgi:hypothetical protein